MKQAEKMEKKKEAEEVKEEDKRGKIEAKSENDTGEVQGGADKDGSLPELDSTCFCPVLANCDITYGSLLP